MADLLEECLADLGSRRAPGTWANIVEVPQEREAMKSERRKLLRQAPKDPSPCPAPPSPTVLPAGTLRRARSASTKALVARLTPAPNHDANANSSRSVTQADKQLALQTCLALKSEPVDTQLTWLPPESEDGHVEYKLKLVNPHPVRLQQLISQMKYRLGEGSGQCFYYLGVEDEGYPKGLAPSELEASIANLHLMAGSLGAHATLLRVFSGAHGRQCALLRVQRGLAKELTYVDLRVAVAGCIDAGKSTLVAVLTRGQGGVPALDSGRGAARLAVLRHKHELESGRTSSLAQHLLGYDAAGTVLNYASASALNLVEMCASAARLLTFIDMGGHERCLKTALYGLTALLPDYMLLCCSATSGAGRVAREHLAVSVALEIPAAVVITKSDMTDADGLAMAVADVQRLVRLAWPQGSAPLIEDAAAARDAAARLGALGAAWRSPGAVASTSAPTIVPIIAVSAVTGANLPLLHTFLHALEAYQQASAPPQVGLGTTSLQPTHSLAETTAASASAAPGASLLPQIATIPEESDDPCGGNSGIGASAPGAAGAFACTDLMGLQAARGDDPVHFQVDHLWPGVPGVGTVVSGRVLSGCIQLGHRLLLGPTALGGFAAVEVSSLQRAHIPVQLVRAGQSAALALALPHPTGLHPLLPCKDSATTSSAPLEPTESLAWRRAGSADEDGEADDEAGADGGGQRPSEPPWPMRDTDSRAPTHVVAVQQAPLDVPPDLIELFDMDSETEAEGPASMGAPRVVSPQPAQTPVAHPAHASTCRTIASGGQEQRPAAADAPARGAHGGASQKRGWPDVGADTAGGSPPLPSLLACSPASAASHRGAVLLCPRLQPCTVWGFEAVLVLLGGQWPPRGLVSGRWPPVEGPGEGERGPEVELRPSCSTTIAGVVPNQSYDSAMSASEPDSGIIEGTSGKAASGSSSSSAELEPQQGWAVGEGSCCWQGEPMQPGGAGSGEADGMLQGAVCRRELLRRRGGSSSSWPRQPIFSCVVHCANVRQQAQVLSLQELGDDAVANDSSSSSSRSRSRSRSSGLLVTANMMAAAALLHSSGHTQGDGAAGLAPDVGCIVRAVLRFEHRSEWLAEGARLVIRDRSTGFVAAAGYVRGVLLPALQAGAC